MIQRPSLHEDSTPLALAPPPLPGETMLSWLLHMAVANDRPYWWIAQRLGYQPDARNRPLIPELNVRIQPGTARILRARTGVALEDLHATTLDQYVGGALRGDGSPHLITAAGLASQNWVNVRGSWYCPLCLTETGGAWDLTWKFPWVYSCPIHQRYLHGRCPGCDDLPQSGRGASRSHPIAFFAAIPDPLSCPNPAYQPARRSGKAAHPCATPLARLSPAPQVTADLADIQRILINRLRPDASDPGRGTWWRDLRATAATLLAIGDYTTPSDITGRPLDAHARNAWALWLLDRDRLEAETRSRYIETGRDPRWTRLETWHHTPQDPALMAAVLPAAVTMLDANSDALARAYENSPEGPDGFTWLPRRLNEAGASDGLKGRLHRLTVAARGTTTRQLRRSPATQR